MLLYTPFLDKTKAEAHCQKYPPLESSLVTACAIAFTKGSVSMYVDHITTFLSSLDGHISRTAVRWKTQGPQVASSLIAQIMDVGTQKNRVWDLFRAHLRRFKIYQQLVKAAKGTWDEPIGIKQIFQAAVSSDLEKINAIKESIRAAVCIDVDNNTIEKVLEVMKTNPRKRDAINKIVKAATGIDPEKDNTMEGILKATVGMDVEKDHAIEEIIKIPEIDTCKLKAAVGVHVKKDDAVEEIVRAIKGTDLDSSENPHDDTIKESLRDVYWRDHKAESPQAHPGYPFPKRYDKNSTFSSADEVGGHALIAWHHATSVNAAKIGDTNTIPYMHLTLAFIWSLAFVPETLPCVEAYVPWSSLVMFLNTLGRSGVVDTQTESAAFPQTRSGVGRQLPEDFLIRGLVWAAYCYPYGFFKGQVVDEDERQLELPSHAAPRAERCLWLGARIDRYLIYDVETKQFSLTAFTASLPAVAASDTFDDSQLHTATMTDDDEFDAVMVDA